MKLRWPDLTDKRQLGVAWTAAAVLVGGALVLGAFTEVTHRGREVREAVAQADILAASVTAALAFDDRDAMREYVDALRANRGVAAAAVYDSRGRALVTYARTGAAPPPAQGPEFGVRRRERAVQVSTPVAERGTRLGGVYLATTPEGVGAILARHGALAILTLMAYVLLAVLSRAGVQLQRRADELAVANDRLTVEMGERARAEEALRQSQKMEALGQLTGGIAHDFNNLLQVMHGAFELIARRAGETDRVKAYAAHGQQAAERGASLARQLLAFSRAQRLELKPFVVSDLIREMREMLVRALGPDIALTFRFEDPGTAVLSDRTQLELAVLNLAINARDAMPQGGELIIAIRERAIAPGHPVLEPDTYVELSVLDTGHGMEPEVAARAFDPFFTTKGVGKGTGLGLSQVYGVARQAGGEAVIESMPGAGTKVVLLLRRSPHPVEPRQAAPALATAKPTARSELVMVVDDDEDVRRLVCDSLDLLGYRVRSAAGGREALKLLEKESPDLMLVDYAMPGMNGAELAAAVRRRRPGLPIVFASGYADTDALQKAVGGEAVVLRKPFELNELGAVVRDALLEGREIDTPAR